MIDAIKKEIGHSFLNLYLCLSCIQSQKKKNRARSNHSFLRKKFTSLPGYHILMSIFIDQKIPPLKRNSFPVIVSADGKLIWVPGLKTSEEFKLTSQTKRALKIPFGTGFCNPLAASHTEQHIRISTYRPLYVEIRCFNVNMGIRKKA